jgi:pimeloyl-ACP methyl ester carboxylesterase
MQKVYFISGLGADERIFEPMLQLLPNVKAIHLNWIMPHDDEAIEDYARRMCARITEPLPTIIGLSFGGMMAIEMAKIIPIKKIILISSAKTKFEIPLMFKLSRIFPFYKIIPIKKFSSNNLVMRFIFGVKTHEQLAALRAVVNHGIDEFNIWAMNKVVHWQNMDVPDNVVHIHGKADKVLPFRYIKNALGIKHGSHLMLITRAVEIADIVNRELQ